MISSIGAGTAADTDQDRPRTRIKRDPDELTGTTRCRVERVERAGVHAPEPRRFRKLDDGLAVPEPSQPCSDGLAGGTAHAMSSCSRARSPRSEEHVEGAVTSIGHGHLDGVGTRVADTACHSRRGRPGAERALERVRRTDRNDVRGARRAATHARPS